MKSQATPHPFARRSSLLAILSLTGCHILSLTVQAQTTWQPQTGDWHTSTGWDNGVPTVSTVARFWISPESPGDEVSITIGTGTGKSAVAKTLQVWSGKEVTLNMTAGSSLSAIAELWRIGYDFNIPSAPASLTINGPASGSATVTAGQIMVGAAPGSDPVNAPAGGHRLTFSGPGLTVLQSGTTASVVGRFGSDNIMEVLNGAHVTRAGINISDANAGAGKTDNGVVVEGAASHLSITGTFNIGAGSKTRSNFTRVGNASFSNPGERATLSVNLLNVGGTTIDNLGGNRLEVGAGGLVRTQGATVIRAHAANGGDNDGANRIVISDRGTFAAGADINVSGLLQLNDGGTLEGRGFTSGSPLPVTVAVTSAGRFEAAGNGLSDSVTTHIDGGTFALGSNAADRTRSSGNQLELQSAINFTGTVSGTLELSWFSEASFDQITFVDGGTLSGNAIQLALHLLPGAEILEGTEWTLFTGETANAITVTFDLSLIDSNLWDTSAFNAAGGWKVVAIPEPGAFVLLGAGLLVLVPLCRRNKK